VREEETRGRRDAETQRWTRRHGDEGTGDGRRGEEQTRGWGEDQWAAIPSLRNGAEREMWNKK